MKSAPLPRVVAIGDSLIYGRLDTRHGGWVGHLKLWLEQEGPEMSALFNLGIGGETSVGALRRARHEVLLREPNLVIVGVGTNDCRSEDPEGPHVVELDDYATALSSLVQLAGQDGAWVAVAGPIPVDESQTQPKDGNYYYNEDMRTYADRARHVAEKESAIFIPFAEVFCKSRGEFDLDHPDLLSDGIHPTPDGHRAMFECAREELTPAFAAWCL